MNLNRKVVEGPIVAGMLVVMTTATSVTSQVVSDEKATAAVQTVVTADENYTAVAGITRQMALVETGRAEVSVEHSDAQLVAASEEGGADETAQTGLAETLPADETKSMPVEITDEDSQNITDTSEDAQDAQVEEQQNADVVETEETAEEALAGQDEAAMQEQEDLADANASSEATVVENTANDIQSDAVAAQLEQEQAKWGG